MDRLEYLDYHQALEFLVPALCRDDFGFLDKSPDTAVITILHWKVGSFTHET